MNQEVVGFLLEISQSNRKSINKIRGIMTVIGVIGLSQRLAEAILVKQRKNEINPRKFKLPIMNNNVFRLTKYMIFEII